jgi:hypothetical protein
MKENFVTYKQALALKELGFDEPCLAFFLNTGKFYTTVEYPHSITYHKQNQLGDYNYDSTSAPLKQDIFKWFRDEHKLYAEINLDSYKEPYYLKVTIKKMDATNTYVEKEFYPYANGIGDIDNDKFEEAESACIDKLIELIKK